MRTRRHGHALRRPQLRERLAVTRRGYGNLDDPNAGLDAELHDDARRFDAMSLSAEALACALAAIELLEAAGWTAVHERARDARGAPGRALPSADASRRPRDETTLVSFASPDPEAERERLAEQGVVVRNIPGRPWLRASVGAWNDESDLERLLEALSSVSADAAAAPRPSRPSARREAAPSRGRAARRPRARSRADARGRRPRCCSRRLRCRPCSPHRLSQNGYGNIFYSAGVKSMLRSWHNFFFVSFDPGGLITVDKPPLALWLQAASAKLFGFSPLSLLLPEAIAGVLAVRAALPDARAAVRRARRRSPARWRWRCSRRSSPSRATTASTRC